MSKKPTPRKQSAQAAAKKTHSLLIVIAVLLAITLATFYLWQQNTINSLNSQVSSLQSQLLPSYTSTKGVTVKLIWPETDTRVTSPLTVMGMVPGNWSQEASFTVKLKNSKGDVVAQSAAQLHGNQMSESLQPFTANLTFSNATESGTGTLVIERANASGLPENNDSINIPVSF